MSTILHLTASMRGQDSISRALSTRLVERLSAGSSATVIARDLSANDLPFVDAARFAAHGAPSDQRTAEQVELAALADSLIAELQAADILVIGIPIYNFGAPAVVKAWADLVARAGTTFHYTPTGPQGLLTGKTAYITVASGGTPVDSAIDFMTPWLRHFLGFLGIQTVEVIAADAIMGPDSDTKIAAAHSAIARLAA